MHGSTQQKIIRTTCLTAMLLAIQISLVILPSCYTSPDFEDNECGIIRRANVTSLKQVFFSPFFNGSFASENDTVFVEDFRHNLEIEYEVLASSSATFSYQSLVADCEPRYLVENISNIQILLRSQFNGLSPGTDISYLFQLADGSQLSRFREFSRMVQFYSLTFHGQAEGIQRLETSTIIFLRDGSQFKVDTISPFLKN